MNEKQLFTDDRMEELFEYWKDTFNKRSSTVFDEARQKKIAVALRTTEWKGKSNQGCALSSWHAETIRRTRNKYLSLIFRNSDKVEMFRDIETESTAQEELDKWINEG